MPSIDLDFLLVAIRIATYGDKMEVGCSCPHCQAENSYEFPLSPWIQNVSNFVYEDTITIDPLHITIRPYTYREMTKLSIKGLEQQKIFTIINDENMSDESKLEKFGESFVKITELTVDVISDCIVKIETPNGSSTDKDQIKEFINNSSKDIFEQISKHVSDIKDKLDLKATNVQCGECSKTFELPITMDQSNFFAVRSSV
jgi:hypothetical protein